MWLCFVLLYSELCEAIFHRLGLIVFISSQNMCLVCRYSLTTDDRIPLRQVYYKTS